MAATVKGYLQLKKKSALKDSWHTYLCEYNSKKRILTVKSKDATVVYWEKEVDKAWPLESKPNRRQNRFDVLSTDGVTAAFSAPKEADMKHWLEVFAARPDQTSPSSAAETEDIIGDITSNRKQSADWVAGPFSDDQFEIAGDEADDSTTNGSMREKSNSVTENRPSPNREMRAQTSPIIEEEPGFLGHVVRWLSQEQSQNEPGVLLEAPKPVSKADVEREAELEQKDLDEVEESKGDEPVILKVYKDVQELLVTHHLGQFVLSFHKHGVDNISELKGCTDTFLSEQVGMKKAHILKFRRALKDADIVPEVATYSVYEAADGFRGTYEDVLAHEQKLGLLDNGKKYKLYEAPDGFRGTYEEVLAHETMLAKLNEGEKKYKLYEAPDGFRGSYEDVVAHEARMGIDTEDPVLLRIYEAPDGFRGTYEEVLAHEEKLKSGETAETTDDVILFRLYEAPDGFRGTYEEVLAHETKLKMSMGNERGVGRSDGEEVLFKLYEAPDGFRGTYEEVLEHERKMGLEVTDGSQSLFSLYEAPDGFRGTYEEVVEHEKKLGIFNEEDPENSLPLAPSALPEDKEPVLFRVYEADDGFRGSYEEVLEHEKKHSLGAHANEEGEPVEDDVNDPVICRIYEAPDGFRGTYEEVLAYEKKHGMVDQNHKDEYEAPKLYQLYEAPDGFRGSYEEVLIHEQEIAGRNGVAYFDKKTHIYESPDGFRGLYDEVLAHEKIMGFVEQSSEQIFVENPKLLLKAVANFQEQVKTLQARIDELENNQKKEHVDNFHDFTRNL